MRRLWFRADMKLAIEQGRKRGTTRNHKLKVGEKYQAVSGSRFKAKPFAVLKITSRREVDSLVEHCSKNHKAEGFDSGQEMADYIRANLPNYIKDYNDVGLYYHTFREVFA